MSFNNDLAISISNLSKMYKVYSKPSDMFWEMATGRPRFNPFWALRDISFDVNKGEIVGIIGRNGAGKSTLLRILAGTLDKTEGDYQIKGKISAILELGTGFNPEYSGRDNIRLGCIYQGMNPSQVEEKMEWIIDFSELEDFIDQPFKTYSSGMQARLTFSTAVSVDPDILIIDEALAAGDAYFVSKSLSRIREICKSGSTVLFVSHLTSTVTSLCNRAVWIECGNLHRIGDPQPIVREYEYEIQQSLSNGVGYIQEIETASINSNQIELATASEKADTPPDIQSEQTDQTQQQQIEPESSPQQEESAQLVFRKGPVFIDKVQFLDRDGNETRAFRRWESLTVRVFYHCEGPIPEYTLGLALGIHRKNDLLRISHFSTMWVARDTDLNDYHQVEFRKRAGKTGMIEGIIDPIQLAEGEYLLSVGLAPNDPIMAPVQFFEQRYEAYTITIIRDGHELDGLVYYPFVKWKHQPDN